jgi:hypothetical protein
MATPPTGCILIFWHLSPAHLTQHTALQYCMAFVHKRLLLVQGHRPQATRACVCVWWCDGGRRLLGAGLAATFLRCMPGHAGCGGKIRISQSQSVVPAAGTCWERREESPEEEESNGGCRPAGWQLYMGGLHCIFALHCACRGFAFRG